MSTVNNVNSWWSGLPQERFWLTVAPEEGTHDVLVVPEGSRTGPASWVNMLPACLAERDVLFHFDPEVQAITSWSRAKGPGARKEPGWTLGGGVDRESRARRSRWMVGLRGRKALESPVPIEEVARVQWDLFPALRALEEKYGDPLYYPFAMGSPDETHPLPCHVFKLPALFVDSFAPLASVARATRPAHQAKGIQAKVAGRAASWWDAVEDFLTERPREAPRAR
jgi:hypothetical protein